MSFGRLFAQESPISVGLHVDWSMESPTWQKFYGVQGKYDLTEKQALQAQVGLADYDMVYFGADYLYTIFSWNKLPSIFLGTGLGYEGVRGSDINDFIINGQVAVQFDIKRFSPYVGYKAKFYFETEGIDPTSLMLGLRFRL